MNIKKYAAIDIGSNAIRLLINNVIFVAGKKPILTKNAIVRVPVRLGQDSFTTGSISDRNIKRLIKSMKSFKLLMDVHGVERYMACATSALREATNAQEVVSMVAKKAKIEIQIIDGKREAEIIASTDLYELISPDSNYLFVDVGGGSTEVTVFSKGQYVNSKSFKMGTVRLLNERINDEVIQSFETWIKTHTRSLDKLTVIGSGGTINKLFKLSGLKQGKPLSYFYMNEQFIKLKKMTTQDRIISLKLNPDRADVIVQATYIYLSAMKFGGAHEILIPKVGLADGIIKQLCH